MLMALSANMTSVVVLKGNHKATLLSVLDNNHDALALWLYIGGRARLVGKLASTGRAN